MESGSSQGMLAQIVSQHGKLSNLAWSVIECLSVPTSCLPKYLGGKHEDSVVKMTGTAHDKKRYLVVGTHDVSAFDSVRKEPSWRAKHFPDSLITFTHLGVYFGTRHLPNGYIYTCRQPGWTNQFFFSLVCFNKTIEILSMGMINVIILLLLETVCSWKFEHIYFIDDWLKSFKAVTAMTADD